LNVVGYEFSKSINDQIVQPEETIWLSNITVSNGGGITLPKGTIFRLRGTETTAWQNQFAEIPELSPGQEYVVPVKFEGKILITHPQPTEQIFLKPALYSTNGTMMNRTLRSSNFISSVNVQYPVRINSTDCPGAMILGDLIAYETLKHNLLPLRHLTSHQSGLQ